MKIGIIDGWTNIYLPPEGMSDCAPLHVLMTEEMSVSQWEPTADERCAIAGGAPIHLQVFGNWHPPVMLVTGAMPERPRMMVLVDQSDLADLREQVTNFKQLIDLQENQYQQVDREFLSELTAYLKTRACTAPSGKVPTALYSQLRALLATSQEKA